MRDALWRLTALRVNATPNDTSQPLLLRAPSIACLWMAALLVLTGLLLLGRVRLPRVTRGAAVVVQPQPNDTTILLLLPASARGHVQPGQHAELDAGRDTVSLDITAVDSTLLDLDTARKRYAGPSVLAQLASPKLVARLSRCGPSRCLTATPGTTYAATMHSGTRTLVSYALSGS